MTRGKWFNFLVGGLALTAIGYFAAPLRPLFGLIVGWSAVIVVFRMARKLPTPRERRPWRLFGLGGALVLLGGLTRVIIETSTGEKDPFPTVAELMNYSGYGCLIAGAVILASLRSTERENDGLIDALIVSVSLSVVAWAVLLSPYVRDGSIPVLDRSANVVYSVLTLLLMAACTRLAVGPGARTPSYYLLAGAVYLLFLSDLLITLDSIHQRNGTLPDLLAPVIFVLFGASSLHPTMSRLTESPADQRVWLTWRRILLLGIALLMGPGVIVWAEVRGQHVDLPVMVVGSTVLAILVLTRLSGLVRSQERTATTEQVLREGERVPRDVHGPAHDESQHPPCGQPARRRGGGPASQHGPRGESKPASCRRGRPPRRRRDRHGNQLDSLPDDMVSTLGHHTAVSLNDTPAIDLGASINFRHPCGVGCPARVSEPTQRCGHHHHRTTAAQPGATQHRVARLDRVARARERHAHREPPAP